MKEKGIEDMQAVQFADMADNNRPVTTSFSPTGTVAADARPAARIRMVIDG